jgi:hypothetical protein
LDLVVWFFVRTVFGLFLASVLGAVGFFAGWMLWDPSMSTSVGSIFRVCGAGIGASIGGFVGWLSPEDTRIMKVVALGLALLGGLGGSWGGLTYGTTVYEGGVLARGTQVSTILGAALASNVLPILLNMYGVSRHGRF